jgi:hypothetical protein
MCFSLTMPDDQLADMAVAGMLPAIREKLFGMEFDNEDHVWFEDRWMVASLCDV